MNKGLGSLEHLVLSQCKGLPSGVTCAMASIEVVPRGVLAVQVSLEPLATEGPAVSPKRTYESKSFVEHIVNLKDDNCDKIKNLLHNVYL